MIRALSLMLVGAVVSGCVVRTNARVRRPRPHAHATVTVRTNNPPPPTATVTVQASQPTLATGVTVVESSCTQGAQEVCNGLDDNCNGQIDEGCGYSSGNIQITLAWNGGADLDMYVADPGGETISYSHTQSQTGGLLDQDARGQCNPNQPNNTIENVYWGDNPPQGDYSVEVHYWDGNRCSTSAGPTQMTLSISVGGRVLGAYNYVINPGDRIPIASFRI